MQAIVSYPLHTHNEHDENEILKKMRLSTCKMKQSSPLKQMAQYFYRGPNLLGAEFVRGRFFQGPSLSGAEMSRNLDIYLIKNNITDYLRKKDFTRNMLSYFLRKF